MAATNGVSRKFVVIGAGWSGLAAALRLSELVQGTDSVILLERKHYAGGRAFSFRDAVTGRTLDNGQHVLLGCCDEVKGFLSKIGMEEAVEFQPLLKIPVVYEGHWSNLTSVRLPGSLHLLPTLMGYRHLTIKDRVRALAMAGAFRVPSARLDDVSYADWLTSHGQSEQSIQRLWDLVGVSVLNTRAQEASAKQAVNAFRTGVVNGWRAARMGNFRVPLGTIGARALAVLRERSVSVQLGAPVSRLLITDQRVTGVMHQDGTRIKADVVVCALPPDALLKIMPDEARTMGYFSELEQLAWSPIVNVYLLYDRPLLDGEMAAFAEGIAQFVFNRGRLLADAELDGRLLVVSVSAANAVRTWSADQLVQAVDAELRRNFVRSKHAQVLAARTVWQPQATLLQAVGTGRLRRGSKTPIAGLWLAGDWTDTGWPASLEGAVRSGLTAAAQAFNG